jgi:signal transduction histidine kinase
VTTRVDPHDELSALARKQEELERLNERRGAFVALAAHELRAPATVVHGIATTLDERQDDLSADQLRRLHGLLHAQTGRLVRLMDQLLDLSRLDSDAVRIERQQLAIRERLERLVESVAGERTGEIELDVPPELEAVVDPDALDRIVSNLVTNALRHGSAPVRISAQQLDRHFRLTVEDAGDGVPPDLQGRLFERFARGDGGPASPDAPGAGLGLAIAQQYAAALGGSIVYEDGAPHGARFRVVFPAPRLAA